MSDLQPTDRPDAVPDATALLRRLEAGDVSASESLLPLVYDQLRAIAGSYFRGQRSDHTLQPTALVHEAYLKLVRGEGDGWRSQTHFCAVAATAMRQVLANHAEARRAAKRGGDARRVPLGDVTTPSGEQRLDIVALDEALTLLREIDERQARVIELWFFGGLPVEQIAEVLEVSERTVERDWRRARAWLNSRLAEDSG